ncbi:hypothetical protein CpecG_0722 [Chlamydia pecorum MC/MarsBar]|uniref:hypothetical protein n=1 Tax=Chlamydia pecorum TaxID=85991 RepID=UPI0003D3EF3E|nr:hypothetical protein [Chlamydia pecorum]ETF38037.1 hypothetical protein CpecF_0723 [Chlamydia pecorum DBDeUG]ETF38305.1 hypothetical protein CpecG_0722 [Chlamydia pecorum MC/MarsBar]ETF40272.1 hypothetical protein CpecA_0722 [Chlamydia pecorum IPTaLE]UBV32290.1 hypothetical protein MarsBar_0732 [Chlamydia pecorum]UBV33237.1 hypothetical protein DBDeUG_0733 [Chlamydia pecorum]
MPVKAHERGAWAGRPEKNIFTLSDFANGNDPVQSCKSRIKKAAAKASDLVSQDKKGFFTQCKTLCTWQNIKPILCAIGLALAALTSIILIVQSGVTLGPGICCVLGFQLVLFSCGIAWFCLRIQALYQQNRASIIEIIT